MGGPGLVTVARTVACKRCGADNLAWVKSAQGKWYLAPTLLDGGVVVAQRFKFHRCDDEARP